MSETPHNSSRNKLLAIEYYNEFSTKKRPLKKYKK